MRLEIPCPCTPFVWSAIPPNSKQGWIASAVVIATLFSIIVSSLSLARILPFLGNIECYFVVSMSIAFFVSGVLVWGLKSKNTSLIQHSAPAPLSNSQQRLLSWIETAYDYPTQTCKTLENRERVQQEDSLLHDTPCELLCEFFSLLDPFSLTKAGETCAKFYLILQNAFFTHRINLYRLANQIIKPLSHPKFTDSNYVMARQCAKLASYHLSLGLTEEADSLSSEAKRYRENTFDTEQKFKLEIKYHLVHLEDLEKQALFHYDKSWSARENRLIKSLLYTMLAKAWRKQGNLENGSKALEMALRFRDSDSKDLSGAASVWRALLKEMILFDQLDAVKKLLKEWPQSQIVPSRNEFEYNKFFIWIFLGIYLFVKGKKDETNEIFLQIEEELITSTRINTSFKINLVAELALAKLEIGDKEGSKQILMKVVSLKQNVVTIYPGTYKTLARICLLLNPNNTAPLEDLMALLPDDKSRIQILLKNLKPSKKRFQY